MFKRNWTTWLKFVNYSNYSTLSSQHNWDDLYDQLMRIFTLILKGIKVLKGSETYEINGYGHIGFANHLPFIACFMALGELDAGVEVSFEE